MAKRSRVPRREPLNALAVLQGTKERADGWQNIYTALGSTDRDKRKGAAFFSDRISEWEAEDLWRGDDIVERIIETKPHTMLREPFQVHITDAKAATPDVVLDDALLAKAFEATSAQMEAMDISKAVVAQLDDLDVRSVLIKAMCTARAMGGSAILLGVQDGFTDWSKPLDFNKIERLDWVTELSPHECWPARYYSNPRSKKFGEPSVFRVQRDTIGGVVKSDAFDVHESRLIRFFGTIVSKRQQAECNSWGESVLTRVLEQVADFQANYQAAGILVQDFAQAVYKVVGLASAVASGPDGDAAIIRRAKLVELSRSVARALLIDKEEDFERKATPLSGLPEMLDRFAKRIAASAKLPASMLFGESPAGLNATGDVNLRYWYDDVANEREKDLRPRVNYLVRVLLCAKLGPTRGVEPAGWEVRFAPLWQMTEKEKAEAHEIQSRTDKGYIDAGVLAPEEVAVSRFGRGEYSYETQLDLETRSVQPVEKPAPAEGTAGGNPQKETKQVA